MKEWREKAARKGQKKGPYSLLGENPADLKKKSEEEGASGGKENERSHLTFKRRKISGKKHLLKRGPASGDCRDEMRGGDKEGV